MRRRSLAVAVALLFATAARTSAQHPLVGLPLDDPAYHQLSGLERQGCRSARVSPFRPYLVGSVRRALREAARDSDCAGVVLEALLSRFGTDSGPTPPDSAAVPAVALSAFTAGAEGTIRATGLGRGEFHPLWRDVRSISEGDPPAVGILRGRLTWNGGPRVVAVAEAFAQSGRRNDPGIRARAFRSTSGVLDVDDAYLSGSVGLLTVSVGREAEAWLGEDRESLMLSANGPPLDRILASARWSRWEARALVGSINDVLLDQTRDSLAPDISPPRYHRFVAAHAVTVHATPALELTVGETSLITSRGAGFNLAFANPATLYIIAENDTSRTGPGADDNNLTAFAAIHIASGRLRVGGEITVDDIQIDAADRQRLPDQLAWRVETTYGLRAAVPASVGLRYQRVDSYTYLRSPYALAYQQYDQPLGSRLGPDADILRASAEVYPNGRLRLSGGIARWRRGALRIDQRPGPSALGHANEPYPTVSADRPAVQGAWLGDAAVEWLDGTMPLTFRGEAAHITNVNNQPLSAGTYFRVQFVGSYRVRFP
ncbi:MAG: hypothetical protein M3068_03335 [Gemmatimonadota bacterium]|nr:hypothetical protein [Gemmatimonadota bacterium]